MALKPGVNVQEATHVKTPSGQIERIVEKRGLDREGRPAKPSQGGFAVKTESGYWVDMWSAREYLKEE